MLTRALPAVRSGVVQAKLSLKQPGAPQVQLLLQYVLELCRFDEDFDLRDRARMLKMVRSRVVP